MIILPEGEALQDVICGDRDYWIISASQNIAHIKPAKEGASTNLNLVTTAGTVYSFLLTEDQNASPDLKVYVNPENTTIAPPRPQYSEADVTKLQAALAAATAAASAANDRAQQRADEALTAFKLQYPAQLQFTYRRPKYEKPFLVRAIGYDGQFTYLRTDAPELPALYELKDGRPALLNYTVQHGLYVIPKVIGVVTSPSASVASRSSRSVEVADETLGTAIITDRRTKPPGVLPRSTQTWLMVALAAGILAIIAFTGRPAPPTSSARVSSAAPDVSPERLRDYQDRLRLLDRNASAIPPSSLPSDALMIQQPIRRRRPIHSSRSSAGAITKVSSRPTSHGHEPRSIHPPPPTPQREIPRSRSPPAQNRRPPSTSASIYTRSLKARSSRPF